MSLQGKQIRAVLLEAIAEQERMRGGSPISGSLQQVSVLREATSRLGERLTPDEEQALLTAWYDLFRTGHLSWGYNLNNPDPPFCHLTEQGRRTLANLSRDPANPDGYMNYLQQISKLGPIARSYTEEALATYNTNCFRAAAVMIGAAAENAALDLRDAVVAGITRTQRTAPKNLHDFRIKFVLDALRKELEMQQSSMSTELREQFDAYWPAFVQQIRAARNDAGHPAAIDPVTPETVHAALLIFPELAKLTTNLIVWTASCYK